MAMSSSPTQNPNWETLDILSNHWSLGPGIVALASCVCKTWYSVMTREHIWKKFCFRRWPSLHHLPKPPGFSYRRFYNLRDLCRCKPTLSLDQLIFVIDIFSVSNDERLISLAVPGEDLTPIDGEEGKFNFMVDLNRKIQFPETELGVEWAVMLKGWDSVFTVMDGGSDSVVQDDFIWIEGELPGCVYPLLGLGFSPCTVKGTLIAEKGKAKLIWQLSLLTTIWSIWKNRNRTVFDGVSQDPGQVADAIRRCVAIWAASLKEFKAFKAIDIWRDPSVFSLRFDLFILK